MEKLVQATPKKDVKSNKPPKKVTKLTVEVSSKPAKEVMALKSGVLKHFKKMANRPCHSPERSNNFSSKGVPQITRKPQINQKGVVIHEILPLVSPAPKKHRVEGMAKWISKKMKRRLVIEDSMDDDEVVPKSPLRDDNMCVTSPTRDSPIKSNLEANGGLHGSVKTYYVDTPINQGDHPKESTPEKTTVIPPGVSNAESVFEVVQTLGIHANISHIDTNVNMGERVSKK